MDGSETSIPYQNETSNSNSASTAAMANVDAQRPLYTVPGILHYLQHEWTRFEIERQQWETERAELQARIAFLQGERQGQENLKAALVRRIKMLEYALKQERTKFNKMKHGSETVAGEDSKSTPEDDENKDEANLNFAGNSVTFKQGRQLLRQYLKEIGYVDTIIDIRSTAVKKLLGIKNDSDVNGDAKAKRVVPNLIKNINHDFDKSLSSLAFLKEEQIVDDDANDDDFDPSRILIKSNHSNANTNVPMENVNDLEGEEAALHEFDFLAGESAVTTEKTNVDWQVDQSKISRLKEEYKRDRQMKQHVSMTITNSNSAAIRQSLSNHNNDELNTEQLDRIMFHNSKNFIEDNTMEGLDELARVTVQNDNDTQYENINASPSEIRKTWNVKFILRSHLDAVRCVTFHPVESMVITGSEDRTLKLWNLDKAAVLRKSNSATQDLEPIYTFRRHTSAVLCAAMNPSGDQFFSGGLDSLISLWNIPNPDVDPYDPYDPNVLVKVLPGHTDAVWQLAVSGQKLLSSSADGSVRIWDSTLSTPLQSTFQNESIPLSIDWLMQDTRQFVVTYDNLKTFIYDTETGQVIREISSNENVDSNYRINRLLCHPNQPIVITAHDDRHIRYFDLQSGRMIHSMVAHLDPVTCLAIDPQQTYLLSGSHDRSIRLWHLEQRNCLQEITAHQKKDEESIHDVAFHSTKPLMASVGADSIAKIYT